MSQKKLLDQLADLKEAVHKLQKEKQQKCVSEIQGLAKMAENSLKINHNNCRRDPNESSILIRHDYHKPNPQNNNSK